VAATGNLLWTEAPFAACVSAAVLLYARSEHRVRRLLVVGALTGAATMIRPVGLALLIAILGWLVLQAWFWPGPDGGPRRAFIGGCAVVLGYLVIAGPWHLRLAIVARTADLTRGHGNFTAWAAAVYQGQITARSAMNLPDRAIWSVPSAWARDPFELFSNYALTWEGASDEKQTYFRAARQDAGGKSFREVQLSAFAYNAFLRPVGGALVWTEVTRTLNCWVSGCVAGVQVDAREHRLRPLVERWRPGTSALRTFCISMSRFVLVHWVWVALTGFIGTVAIFFVDELRAFGPAVLFWWAALLTSSAIAMPVERYVIVTEPGLYVVGVALIGLLARRPISALRGAEASGDRVLDGKTASGMVRPAQGSLTSVQGPDASAS
jgi:hypothetical protein